jgi:hypothetical protein
MSGVRRSRTTSAPGEKYCHEHVPIGWHRSHPDSRFSRALARRSQSSVAARRRQLLDHPRHDACNRGAPRANH